MPKLEFWAKAMEHVEVVEILEPEMLKQQFMQKVNMSLFSMKKPNRLIKCHLSLADISPVDY